MCVNGGGVFTCVKKAACVSQPPGILIEIEQSD